VEAKARQVLRRGSATLADAVYLPVDFRILIFYFDVAGGLRTRAENTIDTAAGSAARPISGKTNGCGSLR
jgi:hypothetical protein